VRHCLNVHGEMLCDGPQHHEGGCTFTSAWQLARHLEDELLSITDYAGDTTNQLRIARDALYQIAAPKRPDGTYNRSREACEQLARKVLDDEYGL
jgi:hypothetical protein